MATRPTKRELSPRQHRLLTDILNITWNSKEPIDAVSYKASHPDAEQDLVWLVSRTMLARAGDRFRVTFFGVAATRSSIARLLLKRANALATLLRERVVDPKTRQNPITVRELAALFDTSTEECVLTLTHLDDAINQWTGGRSPDLSTPDGYILPSERILNWPTAAALVRQLQEWRPALPGAPVISATEVGRPPRATRSPEAIGPVWHRSVQPPALRKLLAEIYRVRTLDCPALTVLGVRAAFDTMCNHTWGDLGTFQEKVQKLVEEGLIGDQQRQLLEVALEVGHATIHRGYIPARRDAAAVHDIVEGLLKQHYALRHHAARAAGRVPPRTKRRG